MKISVTWLSRAAGLASMLLILGCITVPETIPKIEPGFRDYAVMTYHVVPEVEDLQPEEDGDAELPMLSRVELLGTGYVKYYKGRSTRMRDSYWQEVDDKNWNSFYTDQLVIREEQVQEILQGLADAGLISRKRQGDRRQDTAAPYVVVHVRIGDKKGLVISDEPEVVDIYHRLAKPFVNR
jgi:hypothetical protein